MDAIIEIVTAIEKAAYYKDGHVGFPAYLLEQLHNELFPSDQKHDYTEANGIIQVRP